jgi:hypothetical protein
MNTVMNTAMTFSAMNMVMDFLVMNMGFSFVESRRDLVHCLLLEHTAC